MKRYLTFYGEWYYPDAGMQDFIGDYDNIEDCEIAITIIESKKIGIRDTWSQIWDSKERVFIKNTYE